MLPDMPPRPFCLFLDVDGTLLDIAARPDGVVVPEQLRTSLGLLNDRLEGALALVSGRAVADIDSLFLPLRLRASGVHGAEIRFEPYGTIEDAAASPMTEAAVTAIRRLAERHPGTLVENKRFSVAVHYRAAPAAGPVLRTGIEDFLRSPEGDGCRLLPGHMVFEIKHGSFDKGEAIASFCARAPFAGRRPIFVGDDVTDLPGFEQVRAMGGEGYSVTTPRPRVTGHFTDPEAVRAWIDHLAADA